MPLQTSIPPAALPMSVIEARDHVRQDLSSDDAQLDSYIRAATEFAQAECQRTLIATRYRLVLDRFPSGAIKMEYGPVLAVRSVKYLDMSSVQQTMPTADYTADLSTGLCRIAPVFGKIWQPSLPQIGAVEVIFDAGDAAAVTASGNVLTIRGALWRTLTVGDMVRFSNSGGTLPDPLQTDTDYFIQSLPSATSMTLAAAAGGAVIPLTTVGTGTSYIGAIPDGIKAWMKLRLGTLYDHRSDMVIMPRGKLDPLPYVDRLLDFSRVVLA